jgi:hypothetical protein
MRLVSALKPVDSIIWSVRKLCDFVKAEGIGYNYTLCWWAELPLPVEEELCESLRVCHTLDVDEWREVRSAISYVEADKLFVFSVRMCALAIRTKSLELLEFAALAIILDSGDHVDIREVLACVAIIDDAARRLGVTFSNVIDRLAPMARKERWDVIVGYQSRPDSMRRPESMGFKYVESEQGACYMFQPWGL